ncbi:MAG: 50S ribosomal protein L6 [Candidatus Zambryskibacteria bacterium]|nr:50S ribosomal protein L6 [Candidatus Zambryskibacteria bacterium]
MSRIGKKLIIIPNKTEITISNNNVVVKGPLGELSRPFPPDLEIKINGNEVNVLPQKMTLAVRALWGTYASHLANMISGVNKSFEKKLILEGIGFKSEVSGHNLKLALGFSHPVVVLIPDGLKVTAEKNIITVSGSDKEEVGQFASRLRSLKKPEPYKGKGIRYSNEIIRRKQGKKLV